MVIMNLSGGLGNQILECAVARGIANKRGDIPAIDASWYFKPGRLDHEKYMLDVYPLKYGRPIDPKLMYRVTGCLAQTGKFSRFKYMHNAIQHARDIYRIFPRRNCFFYSQMQSITDTAVVKGDVCLYGYPFDYSFFGDISDELREEFVPRDISPALREMAEKITPESVSIHIRVRDEGDVPGSKYYENAVAYMTRQLQKPVFYVFSNNPALAKKVIRFPGVIVFMDDLGAVPSLYLMSRFKRHIIAESTFSWCGAWLSGACGKDIVYPKYWSSAHAPPVLVPADWTPVEGMSYSK